jgi:hypothetical protein
LQLQVSGGLVATSAHSGRHSLQDCFHQNFRNQRMFAMTVPVNQVQLQE